MTVTSCYQEKRQSGAITHDLLSIFKHFINLTQFHYSNDIQIKYHKCGKQKYWQTNPDINHIISLSKLQKVAE